MNGDKGLAVFFKSRSIFCKTLCKPVTGQMSGTRGDVYSIRDTIAGLACFDQFFQDGDWQGCSDRFNVNLDRAATGQTDGKRITVTYPVFQNTWNARFQGLKRFNDNSPLDATAGNRALHLTVTRDCQLGPNTAGRTAPCLDHSRKGRAFSSTMPIQGLLWCVFKHIHQTSPFL